MCSLSSCHEPGAMLGAGGGGVDEADPVHRVQPGIKLSQDWLLEVQAAAAWRAWNNPSPPTREHSFII